MSSTLPQYKEVEFFHFQSLVPDAKARFINSKFEETKYDNNTSLLACSNQYGYFVAGTLEGFAFGQTKHLRDAIDSAKKGQQVDFTQYIEIKAGPLSQLVLSLDELELYVGLEGGMFLVYDIYDIANQEENAQPVSSYQFNNEFNMILPNPTQKEVIAVCLDNSHTCQIYSQSTSTIVATLDHVKSASWLPEGDKIICGCEDGSLTIYDKEGLQQETFPLDDSVKSVFEEYGVDKSDDIYASGVLWVNQDEILVIYSTATDFNHLFFFDKTQFTYLDEIQGAYDDVHPKPQYHFRLLKHFGPNIEYLVTILSASGPDITLVGKQTGASWNKWDTANDNGIPTMPLNDDDGDTFPVGAVVDLGATNPLPPVDPSVSEVPVPPMPILLFLTTDGHVCAYHMYNSVLAQDNLKYQGMVTSKGIAAVTKPVAKSASAPLQLNVNKPPSGFSFASAKTVNSSPSFGTSTASGPGSSTFGNSSFGKTNFGNTSFGNTNVGNTSFGKTNFGNTSFGNTNFGSAAPSAVQTVSLASLATSVSKDPSTNSLDRAFPAPSSTQNSIFQPASLGTATNSPSLNQPSMSNVSMFSSQGAKRTAATPECNGFELGGFSKALASDEREEREETDETDESDGVISSDEEDEYEDQEDYEDQDALSANSTIIKRPEPLFVQYQEKEIQPKTHDRVAKHPSAKTMEDVYFDTLEAIEEIEIVQSILQDKIQFLSKTNLSTHDTSCFDQSEYQWRLGDMNGIKNILQDTLTVSTSMLEQESKNHQLLENTINRDDQVFVTFYNILEFIEKGKDKQADETLKEIATLANQVIMAPIDLHVFNKTLYKQVKDKLERLESKFVSKRPTSLPSIYALRQAIRHIDTTLEKYTSSIHPFSKKETVPNKVIIDPSNTLSELFDNVKRSGLIQKTVAK